MSDKPETTDDIIREMRVLGALDEECADMIPRSQQALGLLRYADRIEAAAERERNAHINDVHDALYAATGIPGNAAALREALESTEELLEHFAKPGTMLRGAFYLHMRDNRAALAEPPRNCDRCDDVEDGVTECMQAIDAAWHEIGTIRATIGWMLATAKGEEARDGHA